MAQPKPENKTDYEGVIFDTSFIIALRDKRHKSHSNANQYFQYFLERNIPCFISVISIGEYCVRGDESEIPLENARVLIYDSFHAKISSMFARILFDEKAEKKLEVSQRNVIPNDVKIFAQAEGSKIISHCISGDSDFNTIYNTLKKHKKLSKLKILDLKKPFHEEMGILFQ